MDLPSCHIGKLTSIIRDTDFHGSFFQVRYTYDSGSKDRPSTLGSSRSRLNTIGQPRRRRLLGRDPRVRKAPCRPNIGDLGAPAPLRPDPGRRRGRDPRARRAGRRGAGAGGASEPGQSHKLPAGRTGGPSAWPAPRPSCRPRPRSATGVPLELWDTPQPQTEQRVDAATGDADHHRGESRPVASGRIRGTASPRQARHRDAAGDEWQLRLRYHQHVVDRGLESEGRRGRLHGRPVRLSRRSRPSGSVRGSASASRMLPAVGRGQLREPSSGRTSPWC